MTLAGLARIRGVAEALVKIPTRRELAAELNVSERYICRLMVEAMADLREGLPWRHYPYIEYAENPKLGRLPVHRSHKKVPRGTPLTKEEIDALADYLSEKPCA